MWESIRRYQSGGVFEKSLVTNKNHIDRPGFRIRFSRGWFVRRGLCTCAPTTRTSCSPSGAPLAEGKELAVVAALSVWEVVGGPKVISDIPLTYISSHTLVERAQERCPTAPHPPITPPPPPPLRKHPLCGM